MNRTSRLPTVDEEKWLKKFKRRAKNLLKGKPSYFEIYLSNEIAGDIVIIDTNTGEEIITGSINIGISEREHE